MGLVPSCCSNDPIVTTDPAEQVLRHKALATSVYDWSTSTEDNYKVAHFTGPHAELRAFLDYTWHCRYSEARMEVQDKFIDEVATGHGALRDGLLPWVVFSAGAMGSGKGYVVQWMHERCILPLGKFVTVDPDQIRSMSLEWPQYVKHNPDKAGDFTQKEAGHIAELLGYRALHDRRNVIIDGSLGNAEWYVDYFGRLREHFPGIRIMILHIVAHLDEVLKRAKERGIKTGRFVPESTLRACAAAVPESVQRLAPFTDMTLRVLNMPGQDPEV